MLWVFFSCPFGAGAWAPLRLRLGSLLVLLDFQPSLLRLQPPGPSSEIFPLQPLSSILPIHWIPFSEDSCETTLTWLEQIRGHNGSAHVGVGGGRLDAHDLSCCLYQLDKLGQMRAVFVFGLFRVEMPEKKKYINKYSYAMDDLGSHK